MPSPQSLLPWLLGGAIGAGGILQGLHWRATAAEGYLESLESQLQLAADEIDVLIRENEALRSLAQGGGEFAVPQELIDRAEKEFGLTFLSNPVVHRIVTEELRGRIAAAYESRFGPAGIDFREEAYARIGWIDPQDRLLPQLTAVRSVGARAWFDDVTGEGWVTDQFSIEEVPDEAALVRLLARILLHQHFPPPPSYPGDDAARAREALHQGAAAGSEARHLAANARSIGFMPMKEDYEVEQLFNSLPTFIQGITVFPVIEGKGLADTLHVQGTEKFLAAFRNPPHSTRQILLPGEPPLPPGELEMPEIPEEPFLGESAGQLGLRLGLDPLGDVGASFEIAADWKNDRYLLFPEGEFSSGLVWDVELQSAESTDSLEGMALDRISAMAGRDGTAKPGELLPADEERYLRISRVSPTRLRFLNISEPATVKWFDSSP